MAVLRPALTLLLVALLAIGSLLVPSPGEALPMYAQRSGRTCANCHVSPTYEDPDGWDNPELADRKCNLSCISCHVDPTGGGLRNASGRYYGQATLPALPTQERGYGDVDRELFSDDAVHTYRRLFDRPAKKQGERSIPSDLDEARGQVGTPQHGNWAAHGSPLGGVGKMDYWDGRYDDLNADPLVQIGGDFRLAYWSGSNSVFPMQADLDVAVQPADHLTVMATVAARGQSSGPAAALSDPRGPVFARRAFVMIHELPGASWAKAGVFMPSFGMYLDDHTAFTREWFEMDVSDSLDTVLGVEVGTAPNYPYATASVFQNDASFGRDDDPGWGASASAGYRDLGWSLTGHLMLKRRGKLARGDLLAGGLTWGYNPAYYRRELPLTLMGELSFGRRVTLQGPQLTIASTTEALYQLRNGLGLRGRLDLGVQHLESGPFQARAQAGAELVPIPGLTLTAFGRLTVRASEEGVSPGMLVMSHVWF